MARPTKKRATGARSSGAAGDLPFHESRICSLVYEDEWLVVVNKKPGFLTVPTERRELNTVVAALCRYLTKKCHKRRMVRIVHRLDRDTSGLLVFGKDPRTGDLLEAQFRDHKPGREYLAIVAGQVALDEGTFRSNMITDAYLNRRSTKDEDRGQLAITHFRVLERLRDTTFVSVSLETGRRNQIRVHFAEKGHPIVGDARYKTQRAAHPRWRGAGLALHAASLSFTHPVSGKPMGFRAPMPRDFEEFLKGERPRSSATSRPAGP